MTNPNRSRTWSDEGEFWRADRDGAAFFVSGAGSVWYAITIKATGGAFCLGKRSTRARALALCEQDAAEQATRRAA